MASKKVKKDEKVKLPTEVFVTRSVGYLGGDLIVSDTIDDADDGDDVGVYVLSEVRKKRVTHELE